MNEVKEIKDYYGSSTTDVNIVVKDLFEYIKSKCRKRIRIIDIMALLLSILSIVISVVLTFVDKDSESANHELTTLFLILRVIKDTTIAAFLLLAIIMICYEIQYLKKENTQFKRIYLNPNNFDVENIVQSIMDRTNIFDFKKWNEVALHVKYYRKTTVYKKNIILISILKHYKLPVNKWNLMYLSKIVDYLNRKQSHHTIRLWFFTIITPIIVILISVFPIILLV